MRRIVDGRNDLDVAGFRVIDKLGQLVAVIEFVGIRIGVGSIPAHDVIADHPAEIVAVGVEHGVAAAVAPDVRADALILSHVQIHGIIAHPRHFVDQVLDPVHRPVFSADIELNRALLCVGLIHDRAGADLIAVKELQQRVEAIEQAVVVALAVIKAHNVAGRVFDGCILGSHGETELLIAKAGVFADD